MSKPKKKPAKKRDDKIGTYRCRSCNDYGAMKYKGECLLCFTRRTNPLAREARASCSLDGETQSCRLCHWRSRDDLTSLPIGEHTCSKRPMTAEERAVVDEIVRACEVDASRHTPYVQALAAKIRAARKEGK